MSNVFFEYHDVTTSTDDSLRAYLETERECIETGLSGITGERRAKWLDRLDDIRETLYVLTLPRLPDILPA